MREPRTTSSLPSGVAVRLLGVCLPVIGVTWWLGGQIEPKWWIDEVRWWPGPLYAASTLAVVVATAAITRTGSQPATWWAGLGLVLVAYGSGIGRARKEVWGEAPEDQFGNTAFIQRLDTSWISVGAGMALLVGATWFATRGAGRGARGRVAVGTFAAVGLATLVVTVLRRDLVASYGWVD